MIVNLFIAAHAFPIRALTSFSVKEMLLPKYLNCSTEFRSLPSMVEMSLLFLKDMNSVLSEFTYRPTFRAAFSRLCSKDSACAGVFASSARSSA